MGKKKIILEICNFSSGISGVWTRAYEDAKEFINQGYDVRVFSSNETENGEIVSNTENINGIKINRFSILKRNGYALWLKGLKKEISKLNPEIIIAHGLRKPYLKTAVNVSKEIGAKCYCVTHAPFINKNLRSWKLNVIIKLYDNFIGKKIMNSFNKIITICKWEKNVLLDLGCNEDKIEYIPNSLSDDFFNDQSVEEQKKILFLGRMHPVKNLELI